MTKEALNLALEAYLCREMPAGTVIGAPKWWTPRIANAIKEALAHQAAVEHELAEAYRTELDKLSQRNYELRMENAQLKAQPKEPEQEPVAWMNDSTPSGIFARHMEGAKNFGCTIPLYTTPPQRKPLTDEMLDDIYYCVEGGRNELETWRQQARAVEAAHGIKE